MVDGCTTGRDSTGQNRDPGGLWGWLNGRSSLAEGRAEPVCEMLVSESHYDTRHNAARGRGTLPWTSSVRCLWHITNSLTQKF